MLTHPSTHDAYRPNTEPLMPPTGPFQCDVQKIFHSTCILNFFCKVALAVAMFQCSIVCITLHLIVFTTPKHN